MYEEPDHDPRAEKNKMIMRSANWTELPGCKAGGGINTWASHLISGSVQYPAVWVNTGRGGFNDEIFIYLLPLTVVRCRCPLLLCFCGELKLLDDCFNIKTFKKLFSGNVFDMKNMFIWLFKLDVLHAFCPPIHSFIMTENWTFSKRIFSISSFGCWQ